MHHFIAHDINLLYGIFDPPSKNHPSWHLVVFQEIPFEIFRYENLTSAWYCACVLSTKILMVFIIANLFYH